jgi:hypothetical protein
VQARAGSRMQAAGVHMRRAATLSLEHPVRAARPGRTLVKVRDTRTTLRLHSRPLAV